MTDITPGEVPHRTQAASAEELGEPPHVETAMADLAVVSGNAVRPVSGQPQQLSHIARGQPGLLSPRQPYRCGHHRGSEG